jgi:ABC-type phosphate transport system substrate-binding protein
MNRTRIAAAFAVLALAGCGGSAASSTTASSTTASPPTAAAVARHLGCTGITQTDPVSDFAADEVDATCQGHHADIATFTTDQLRDEWATFVRQTGGTVTTGELYAVGTGY